MSDDIVTRVETTPHDGDPDSDETIEEIVARGPVGAFAVAGIATAIVIAIYFAFYVFVYLPRGVVR